MRGGSQPPSGPGPGLHAERTVLAWQRTALALLVGVLAVGRLVLDDLPWLGVGLVVVAVPLTWSLVRLASAVTRRPPDGRLPALTTALVLTVGVVELVHAVGS